MKSNMNFKKLSDEVVVSTESIVKVTKQDIVFLKQKSQDNIRKRIRLCSHKNIDDKLHEMFIVHTKDTYVRPHKHLNKSESVHVIEGLADIVFFDESGKITETISIGDYNSGKMFYYRIDEPLYHMLIIRSDFLVFHEVTTGPFNRQDMIFAPWSPDEKESDRVIEFVSKIFR